MFDKISSAPKSKFQNLTDSGSWELETAGGGKHYLRWQGIWAGKNRNWRIAQITTSGHLYNILHVNDDSAGIRRRLLNEFQTKPELQFARDRLNCFLKELREVRKPNQIDW